MLNERHRLDFSAFSLPLSLENLLVPVDVLLHSLDLVRTSFSFWIAFLSLRRNLMKHGEF